MKNVFEKYIREKVRKPSETEVQEILAVFHQRLYDKGEFFKKPHTISKELGFLVDGNVQAVFYKKNGDVATFRIIEENSFIGDVVSVKTQQPTPIGFECLGKVSILIAPIQEMNKLLETNLAFNIIMREYITAGAIEMGKRHIQFLTGNAKERYQFILENNPNLLKKFPLRLIASLIGITPTQLSRIRNKDID